MVWPRVVGVDRSQDKCSKPGRLPSLTMIIITSEEGGVVMCGYVCRDWNQAA